MQQLWRDGSLAQVNRNGSDGRSRHPASVHRPASARLSACHGHFASMRSITACSSFGVWTASISRRSSHSSFRCSNRNGRPAWSGRSSRCRRSANSRVSPWNITTVTAFELGVQA